MAAIKDEISAKRPHVFLSYSWSSPDHQAWVREIAQELTEANVHVLFDGWELDPGADTLTFMERAVNDPKVTKVVILADKKYVEKANGRSGGVGTETQIISPEIYGSTSPGKFALVVCERDEEGKPYLPAYYKSKMFIDFSDAARYADEFERLLRWIFNKPADVRPAYGSTPSFVTKPDAISLGTETQARRTLDALHTGKPTALGAFTEYLSVCVRNLERFRIVRVSGLEFDDQVVTSIEALRPFKDQLLGIVDAVAVHAELSIYGTRLHAFFENFYQLTQRSPTAVGGWVDSDFDNFAFMLHETFISVCALLIKKQRFDLVTTLLDVEYYLPRSQSRSDAVASYTRFSEFQLPSLEERKMRLSLGRESLRADFLMARTTDSILSQQDLMQTDLVLFLRSKIRDIHWFPTTYMFATMQQPFELFARAASAAFFERICSTVLGTKSLDEFKSALAGFANRPYARHGGRYETLTGLNDLATRP